MKKLGPFELGKVHCVDCVDAMKLLPDKCVDAVVTDPPYGIGCEYNTYNDSKDAWKGLMCVVVPEIKRISSFAIMPACDRYEMKWWYETFPPEWMVAWYKGSPGHRSPIGFNDWEPHLTWGRPSRPMHDYFTTKCGFEISGHPCPKPLTYSLWLCERAAPVGGIIADPFMGSGTTGVACVQTGRDFLGFELDPEYCRIANDRIAAARKGVTLKEHRSGQESLFA